MGEALYPQHAYEVETTADTLTVYAPTKRITRRGDVLNQAVLTVDSHRRCRCDSRQAHALCGRATQATALRTGEQRPRL